MSDGKLQLWRGQLLISNVVNADSEEDEGKITKVDECCCPDDPALCSDHCTDEHFPDSFKLTVSGFSGYSDYCSEYQCACEDGTYYLEGSVEDNCIAWTGLGAPEAACRICQIDAFQIQVTGSGDDHLLIVRAYDRKSGGTVIYTWEKNYGENTIDCMNLNDDIPLTSTHESAECTAPATVNVQTAHGAAATDWPQELCRNCDDCGVNFPAQVRVIPTTNVIDWMCRYPLGDYGNCAGAFDQIVYLDRFSCDSNIDFGGTNTTTCIYTGTIFGDLSGCPKYIGGWYLGCPHRFGYDYPNIIFVIHKDGGAATTTLRLTIERAPLSMNNDGDWVWEATYATDGYDCNGLDVQLPMTNNPLCYHWVTGGALGGSMCEFIDDTAQVTAVL